jgi:hypothetical protein
MTQTTKNTHRLYLNAGSDVFTRVEVRRIVRIAIKKFSAYKYTGGNNPHYDIESIDDEEQHAIDIAVEDAARELIAPRYGSASKECFRAWTRVCSSWEDPANDPKAA